ncbi:MAG: FtsW/RodA/SpoVE family cell cycle protein [Patescibacteria group bacterium]
MGQRNFYFDSLTAILLLCLGSFGLFLFLTIDKALFIQQLSYFLLGFILLLLLLRLDPLILWYFAPLGYIFSIIFLALSYLGPSIRGATRWIIVGGVQLQPSELVKPLLLLAFARLMSQYPPRNWRFLALHIFLFVVPFILVFRQPDLGSSLIYAGFWLAMLVAGGLPLLFQFLGILTMGILAPVGWHFLAAYQKARILTFLNPTLDPRGAGYNALQAMIAVGSGQIFGRGLGLGTQSHLRFLPEYHTDFVFATLIEELGFLGGSLLLLLYAALLWRIIEPLVKGKVKEAFPFIYSVGLFTTILVQIFINSGMNMGIIPITGITLPFVSYGGSSVFSLAISFALLWVIRRTGDSESRIAIGGSS